MEVDNRPVILEDWEWGYFIDPADNKPLFPQKKPMIRYHSYMPKIDESNSNESFDEITKYNSHPNTYNYSISRTILYILCKAFNWLYDN